VSTGVCALTGGNGYVGSRIRKTLEANGWEVVLLQRKTAPDSSENAVDWRLQSEQSIASELRFRSVQALVHAAWALSVTDRSEYERTNFDGSRRLLQAAHTADVRRIVFISTNSAFEQAVSLYGRTKLAVERVTSSLGGISVRPGLVWGDQPGGMLGSIRQAVRRARVVPLIGSGKYPQYLIHEDDLSAAVAHLCRDSRKPAQPITAAHPAMWYFRDIVRACAGLEGQHVKLVSVPWRFVYGSLKLAEWVGLHPGFRSDSVLSLVHQNPAPDFSGIESLGIPLRPFPKASA
jgi:nucleoside-diphosphate-sugar epimerase